MKNKHFNLKDREGEKWISNEGYKMEIIKYYDRKNCNIQFEGGCIVQNLEYCAVKDGRVKNPLHKSVYKIGYQGLGRYSNTIHNRIYMIWHGMIQRCYSEKYHKRQPTYIGCSVDEQWHNFQVFAKWYEENWKSWMNIGWELDKDILLKGNKVYSPETCCFVPKEINNLIKTNKNRRGLYPIGVVKHHGGYRSQVNINGERIRSEIYKTPEKAFQAYKKAKEKEIKSMARVCKSILEPRVYQALIDYRVEITD